eukprot:1160379-Pelagomonas_calceolata.AAC.4
MAVCKGRVAVHQSGSASKLQCRGAAWQRARVCSVAACQSVQCAERQCGRVVVCQNGSALQRGNVAEWQHVKAEQQFVRVAVWKGKVQC